MRDTSEQRDNLLSHAATELANRGFGDTRLRDIAKSAGVSIGMVQHHFESRDHLLTAAFEWSIENLLTNWQHAAQVNQRPWQTLRSLVDSLTEDPGLTQRATTWAEFCVSASRHEELRDGVQRVYRTWRGLLLQLVSAGIESGDFKPALPADRAAEVLSTLVDGCDLAMATGSAVMTAEEYKQVLLDAITVVLNVADE